MSIIDRLRSTQVSSRVAAVCIGLLLLAAMVVVVAAKNSASSVPPRPKAKTAKPAAKAKQVNVEVRERTPSDAKEKSKAKPTAQAKPAPQAAAAPKEDPYAVIVQRNLFRPVQPAAVTPPPPPTPPKVTPLPPMPAGPPKPDVSEFKKTIAFTGLVETPTGRQALLEKFSSKETRFVAEGEEAFGCRLVKIAERSVTLEKDGSQFNLNIGENKPGADSGAKPSEAKPESGKDSKK
ncbi:MAG TPA: hypothetical protein VMX94_06360 [Armatimonadota bacterium]|nr:hypothetical protein [Armatimonadota bacterium]